LLNHQQRPLVAEQPEHAGDSVRFRNFASRTGIERLGAKLDGILRSHQLVPDGTRRDTVVYSILDVEWPTVRTHLQFRLDRPR
jgi:hypothetical protein